MSQDMPPRSSLTSSFSVSDANNEVICPLTNQDGSNCRKRCLGEKRFRSMQEHIRRAHPDHYIPKLPATEESFQLMINTPPSQRTQPAPDAPSSRRGPSDASDRDIYGADISAPATPRTIEDAYPAAANAAVALAQLHHNNLAPEWESEADAYSEPELRRESMRNSVELPSIRDQFRQDQFPSFYARKATDQASSVLGSSPPGGRSSTLPPLQRKEKPSRSRKVSVGQNARKAKHERNKSKEYARRLSMEGRKAMSAEPASYRAQGKRWEDLIEAATSATEAEDDRDLTPIPQSPSYASATTLQPLGAHRSSLPPGFRHSGHFQPQSYTASPLQNALTPPPPDPPAYNDTEPFPSVESSMESSASGQNFHISASGLPTSASTNEDSSPMQEIYCASCARPWGLDLCFACTECICAVCRDCIGTVMNSTPVGPPGFAPIRRGCPKCHSIVGQWRKFQLDFR